MKIYYTYAFLRENKTPYYIGKGKKKYGKYYTRTTAKHGGIPVPPKERILILKEFDIEFNAYKHENYMIKVFGRKDIGTGILHNRTDGGEGHTNMSEYGRRRCSETHKGKVLSEETKNKIFLTRRKRKYKCSSELKEKYSKLYSGEGNPNYGKKHNPETLKKISKATKGKNTKTRYYISPEGVIIKVDNLREFCEKNSLYYPSMILLYNEKCFSYKGYMKYNSNLKKVNHWIGRKHNENSKAKIRESRLKYIYTVIDPEGNKYETKYLKEFCIKNDLNSEMIRRVSVGDVKSHKGWTAIRDLIPKV